MTWGQTVPYSRACRQLQRFSTSANRLPSLRRALTVPVPACTTPPRTGSIQSTDITFPASQRERPSCIARHPPISNNISLDSTDGIGLFSDILLNRMGIRQGGATLLSAPCF